MKVLFDPSVGFENAMLAFLSSGFPMTMDGVCYTGRNEYAPWHNSDTDIEADVISVNGEDDSVEHDIMWMKQMEYSYIPPIVKSVAESMYWFDGTINREPATSMLSSRTMFFVRNDRKIIEICELTFGALAAALDLQPSPDCGWVDRNGRNVPIWWNPSVGDIRCTAIGVDPARAGILGLMMAVSGISLMRCRGKLIAIFDE